MSLEETQQQSEQENSSTSSTTSGAQQQQRRRETTTQPDQLQQHRDQVKAEQQLPTSQPDTTSAGAAEPSPAHIELHTLSLDSNNGSNSISSTSSGISSHDNVAFRTRSRCSKRKREVSVPSSTSQQQQQTQAQLDVREITTSMTANSSTSNTSNTINSSVANSLPLSSSPFTPFQRKKSRQKIGAAEDLSFGHRKDAKAEGEPARKVESSLTGEKAGKLQKLENVGKGKGTGISDPPLCVNECGICLEPVKQRGLLDTCEHMFCFSCIITWAKRSSSCPHCKRDISSISKSEVTGKIVETIQIRKRSLRETLDREEFLLRSRDPTSRMRQNQHGHSRQYGMSSRLGTRRSNNTDFQRLLNMHYMIRDDMVRMTTSLRGLQANLSNLALLNVSGSVLPQQLSFCNIPTFAANINVTVNGSPVGQPTNVALSGYSVVDNTDYLPNPFFRYQAAANNGSVANMGQQIGLNPFAQLHQQVQQLQRVNQFPNLNFSLPPSMLPAPGIFPQEIAQSLDMLTRIGQNHMQQLAAMQAANGQQQQGFPANNPFSGQR